MPYLDPSHVLREFSSFAREEIRPALADDERFVAAQVGSMASTLQYLAAELDAGGEAVATQREALGDALDDAADVLRNADADGAEAAFAAVTDAQQRVAELGDDTREAEDELLDAADEALAAIDGLEDETAKAARRPLYAFLDARLETHLRMLGREPDDE